MNWFERAIVRASDRLNAETDDVDRQIDTIITATMNETLNQAIGFAVHVTQVGQEEFDTMAKTKIKRMIHNDLLPTTAIRMALCRQRLSALILNELVEFEARHQRFIAEEISGDAASAVYAPLTKSEVDTITAREIEGHPVIEWINTHCDNALSVVVAITKKDAVRARTAIEYVQFVNTDIKAVFESLKQSCMKAFHAFLAMGRVQNEILVATQLDNIFQRFAR